MFQRVIDDFRESIGSVLRLTLLAATVALALFMTTSFLCAAAFIFVLERYGQVEACLSDAGIFLVVAIVAAVAICIAKTRWKPAPRNGEKSAILPH